MGIRLTFQDNGPGIPDIQMALRDGFTTGSGLGLGFGGAKRLVNEFEVTSRAGGRHQGGDYPMEVAMPQGLSNW